MILSLNLRPFSLFSSLLLPCPLSPGVRIWLSKSGEYFQNHPGMLLWARKHGKHSALASAAPGSCGLPSLQAFESPGALDSLDGGNRWPSTLGLQWTFICSLGLRAPRLSPRNGDESCHLRKRSLVSTGGEEAGSRLHEGPAAAPARDDSRLMCGRGELREGPGENPGDSIADGMWGAGETRLAPGDSRISDRTVDRRKEEA